MPLDSFDDDLRRALKPVDPGPEFTARVLAAVDAGSRERGATPASTTSGARRDPRVRWWSRAGRAGWGRRSLIWPALAASLVGVAVGARIVEERRETERGLQARAQLMQALRLTSDKLNVAREVVKDLQ
jgi:hypothetical protein